MIQDKWTKSILKHGWAPIPVNLLKMQSKLGINSTEMIVLINLISFWRSKEDLIYPSQESLASNLGVTKRTIQRSMRNLEKLNLIAISETSKKNEQYQGRNIYDITPLIEKLNILLEIEQ